MSLTVFEVAANGPFVVVRRKKPTQRLKFLGSLAYVISRRRVPASIPCPAISLGTFTCFEEYGDMITGKRLNLLHVHMYTLRPGWQIQVGMSSPGLITRQISIEYDRDSSILPLKIFSQLSIQQQLRFSALCLSGEICRSQLIATPFPKNGTRRGAATLASWRNSVI